MSVQALGWVLDHSPAKGSDRLVLVSIANHAGKTADGGAWEAYPGIATIAREAGLDRARTVNDALARLVDAGQLERIVNGAPDERIRRDKRPNLYRILLESGVTCDDTRCGFCRVTLGAERGDGSAPNGVTDGDLAGCRETSPKPSEEPSQEPEGQPSRAKRASSFPEAFFVTEAMRAWHAEHTPSVDIKTETAQFADYHRAKGDTARDWVASWRTWMRNAVKFSAGRRSPSSPPSVDRNIETDRDKPSGRVSDEELWGNG